MNGSNTHIIIFGVANTVLVDLVNGNYFSLPLIPAIDSAVDNNSIFTCYNNVIRQMDVSLEYFPPEDSEFYF